LWDNVDFLTDLLKDDEHKQFINSRDSWGRTALHAACTNEGSGCLEILLSAGGNTSQFDPANNSKSLMIN